MSSIRGVNVGGNLFDVTDSSNVAPIETTNFASRPYAKDRCFIMADGLLYRATAQIESGDPIVINGNCRRTTLDEIISVIETDSDLIAPTEDGATSSDDYVVGDEIVRSGILYNVISAIAEGDAFVIGNNIDIAGSLTSQIKALANNDNAMFNVLGAKNLLPNNATSQTVNGVTFTKNPNGSVTVNGTATNIAYIDLFLQTSSITDFDVILTGCPSGGGANSYELLATLAISGTSEYYRDYGDGVIIPSANSSQVTQKTINVRVLVRAGVTINKTFYPMIRPTVVKDGTYTPYAMTNRELSKKAIKNALLTRTTSSIGNVVSSMLAADVWCLGAQSTGFIVMPFIDSSGYWAFRVLNSDGTPHANTSVIIRYFYADSDY